MGSLKTDDARVRLTKRRKKVQMQHADNTRVGSTPSHSLVSKTHERVLSFQAAFSESGVVDVGVYVPVDGGQGLA